MLKSQTSLECALTHHPCKLGTSARADVALKQPPATFTLVIYSCFNLETNVSNIIQGNAEMREAYCEKFCKSLSLIFRIHIVL